jgi:hypothetical protein
MFMKSIKSFLFVTVFIFAVSCTGMYDVAEDFLGEVIYPAKFDTIYGRLGLERVEIDLMKAGRLPAGKMYLGKAVKTVVECNGERLKVYDSLCSWVNITGLNTTKLYRFRIYTEDDRGNRSIPQELPVVPFVTQDIQALEVPAPRITVSPASAIIDWPNGLNSVIMEFVSLDFKYTDRDGIERTGQSGGSPRIFVGNLEPNSERSLTIDYTVRPILSNGDRLLDEVMVTDRIPFTTTDANTPFVPVERAMLEANGVTEFTAGSAAAVQKLVFPPHVASLADLFYFSGLKELDLTGGEGFNLPFTTYSNNSLTSTIGGGAWAPFLISAENPLATDNSASNTVAGVQSMVDLLESGILEKVKYIPHSKANFDAVLAPFIETGQVELVNTEEPEYVMMPNRFHWLSAVGDLNWSMDVTYPATDVPFDDQLIDAGNVYKTVLIRRSAALSFFLPVGYRLDAENYRYLKVKLFTPSPDEAFNVPPSTNYYRYKTIWGRFMNRTWWAGTNPDTKWGQEVWDDGGNPSLASAAKHEQFTIPDANLRTRWTEFTFDMQYVDGNNKGALTRHTRVFVLNLGGEPSGADIGDAANGILSTVNPIVMYFADIRFSKTP